jgi:O-antigen/teichoic acid export membrane protein
MLESRRLFHSTVVLTAGQVVAYGLSFLRNLILARILAKADYGLASVFAMALTLLEVGGRMAFGIQVIQSKEGDSAGFQDSAHALQFVGGVCSAVLIAGLSVPVARLFGVPQTWWAFALLAVVPLCQGLGHLDISRRQRELDYLPLVLADVVPQALITLAAWPLALWLRDFRVIIWLMIAKAIVGTGMTFVFARRPYRWAWERTRLRSMLMFGWPLLLNGLVMFGCQQADQMLVGAKFSLNVLASYALAFSLASIPWFISGQVGSALMLPILSRAQDDPERLRRQYRVCIQAAAAAGVIFTLPIILAGEQLVRSLYGAKYQGTGVFVALLGAAFAVRFLRFVPAVVATARADTMNQLYSNLWRGASFPLALCVVFFGGTPVQIAACAVIAEMLATVVSAVLLWRRQGVPLRESYGAAIYLVVFVSAGLAVALLGGADLNTAWLAVVVTGGLLLALGAACFMSPESARSLIDAVRRRSVVIVGNPSLR